MKKLKETLFRMLFASESILFAYLYVFGMNGLCDVWRIEAESAKVQIMINQTKQEIALLEQEKSHWMHDEFYKEKCAREQLHMARANEEVYYFERSLK